MSKKPRRVRARRREDIEIRFLRRHKVNCPKGAREGPLGDVRRRKHFSPRKRANCPCSTDSECAAAGCNPFVKKGFTFFDSLLKSRQSLLFKAVEKGHFGLFRQKLHDGWSSIPCGKVTPSVMRGVIFEAHPPGDLLLPLRGNSPCVPENDRIKFYSTACGRRNSLQEGFFDKLEPPRKWGGSNFLKNF